MEIYIIIGILVIILVYVLITYNILVKCQTRVDEAFSTMDVFLKKRWDLIPNIVESVKGYAKYEENTLKEIIDIRNTSYDEMDINNKVNINQKLTHDVNKLMILAESYPDLKANENFINLNNQLTKIEEDIANSRKYYNGTVRIMNNKVQMFPSNIVAIIFRFKEQKMFEIDDNQRANVKIEL